MCMCMYQVEEMVERTAAGLPQVSKPDDKKAGSTPAWNIHSVSTKVTANATGWHRLCLAIAPSRILWRLPKEIEKTDVLLRTRACLWCPEETYEGRIEADPAQLRRPLEV